MLPSPPPGVFRPYCRKLFISAPPRAIDGNPSCQILSSSKMLVFDLRPVRTISAKEVFPSNGDGEGLLRKRVVRNVNPYQILARIYASCLCHVNPFYFSPLLPQNRRDIPSVGLVLFGNVSRF